MCRDIPHTLYRSHTTGHRFSLCSLGSNMLSSTETLCHIKRIDYVVTRQVYAGGIRCDVYSAHLRDKGFNNLYTLEGGVQNYLRQEGHDMWDGSLFVFDGRMAVPSGQTCIANFCFGVFWACRTLNYFCNMCISVLSGPWMAWLCAGCPTTHLQSDSKQH